MKSMFMMLMAAAAVVVGATEAKAQTLELGYPITGGPGCPAGSASVTMSPDASQVSILFDQYIVEAGGPTGRRLDYKSCNVRVPVRVPQGYSMSVFKVDYRGFASIPYGGLGTFTTEYFFADQRGPRQTRRFYGPSNQDYLVSDDIGVEAVVWSACGASTILAANTSMRVQTNNRMEQAMATVDSADISAGVIYHVRWKRCH